MTSHRWVSVTSALSGVVLAVGALSAPATAAPNKIGPVSNLTLTAARADGGGYAVSSSWTPLAGATSYKVALTSGGTSVASVQLTSPPWTGTVNLAPNSQIQVTVTPMQTNRPGTPASAVYTLPDVTPPSGTFTTSTSGMDATLTQVALSDDATPAAQVRRTVTWGDGTAAQPWTSGATVSHNYAALGRYVPTVTLADNAGNSVVLTMKAAVFGDTTAPSANMASGPSSAIARWTRVNLNVESLSDNYTPAELIERTVSWGDGSTEPWKEGATLSHVYAVAGTFTPSVVAVDEAGNSSKTAADPITVTVDADGPVVTVTTPRAATKVRSWKTVKGTAKDAGVGTASVALTLVEKRGTAWYAYRASTRSWVKAGTRARAWKKATPVAAVLDRSAWSAGIGGLRKGKLLVHAGALDRLGNASATVSKAAKLTS